MSVRRGHLRRNERRLTPELRPLAERLLELDEAHAAAIRGGDQSFYADGRHEELVELLPVVSRALGLKPWHDSHRLIRKALNES